MPSTDGAPPEWEQSLYEELRPLAHAALARENPGLSLQPTLLINDAYLKLQKQQNLAGAERGEVLAAAAKIMRRLIIDHCRMRQADKRGGRLRRVALDAETADRDRSLEILELHDALETLQKQHPRCARVVELKFFGGLTLELVADVLDVSLSTVNSDWRFAKAWLSREMQAEN